MAWDWRLRKDEQWWVKYGMEKGSTSKIGNTSGWHMGRVRIGCLMQSGV